YPLGMSRSLAEGHPEWRTQFLEMEGVKPSSDYGEYYCCYNSPYGQLLPELVTEIIGEVGFDGVWFDGSTFSNHNSYPAYAPGCGCGFCRERFFRDTGLDLPERVDFEDRTFRHWVNWRYDVLMDVYKRVVEAATAAKRDALICFNNYRRRCVITLGWNTAIPLRRIGLDAIMSTEIDAFCDQADFQIKLNKAFGCKRGVESWVALCDYWSMWMPDTEPLSAVQAALGGISAGGGISSGIGVDPSLITDTLKAMQDAAAPRTPYMGGETVEYAAILCSQQTQDFYGKGDPMPIYDEWHGANEFCRHAHLQSSVIFDDHVSGGDLGRYPLVILGNAVCLSQAQAERLEEYVEQGGTLLACYRAGMCDELGYAHERPVLDGLLGISYRRALDGVCPTFELRDDALKAVCGKWVSFRDAMVIAEPAGDVQVLADVIARPYNVYSETWEEDWVDRGTEDQARVPKPSHPGIWTRRVGKGQVIYSSVNLFRSYLQTPTLRGLKLLSHIVRQAALPALDLEGPMCVTLNCRVQEDGRWAVHLHNAPGSVYRYPHAPSVNNLHSPGEVLPVYGLRLRINGKPVASASSGVTGEAFEVADGGRAVVIPRIDLQDVVLLRF
ncbi:MAG TPA: beta-galactosidase trimerization domain-containing protein, partial [Chloroflexota bacterium]|nr:beta-galactosidase trimerization domain-containing protein [Chloroflexota bacterium]